MRKLLFAILFILLTTSCFASEQVYQLGSDNKIVTPLAMGSSITSSQLNNISSSAAVVLGATQTVSSIIITASATNKDFVYVGPSSLTSSNGYKLSSGSTVTLNVDNIFDVYVLGGNAVGGNSTAISYVATVR